MAKISKTDIYVPDTTLSPNDTWVGSDAQDFFKTKTFTAGGILDYILVNYGGTEQNNIVVEKPLGDIDTTVENALIDTINGLEAYTVAANEIIAFTGSFLEANNAIPKKFVYLLQTGKGYYGVNATQVTEGDLLLINPFQPQIEANTQIINNLATTEVDRIISGGAFYWTEVDLVFQWANFTYSFGGEIFIIGYSNPGYPNVTTLDAPDVGETDARIDLIVIDGIAQDVIVVKGIPSPTPQEPSLAFGTQLRLTAIYVPATGDPEVVDPDGGTDPITNITVFDENLGDPVEWDFIPATGIVASTNDFHNGTLSIEATNPQSYQLKLETATPVLSSTIDVFSFWIKIKEDFGSDQISIYFTNGTVSSSYVRVTNGKYGFDSSDLEWQKITIALNAISAPLPQIDKIAIVLDAPKLGYFIDEVGFQPSLVIVDPIIPTRTSDLINDGEDGVSPFITDLGGVAIVKLDEGNGIGYVSEGSDRTLFGNIGFNALDLSLSGGASTTRGATGEHSVALGDDVISSGYGSFATGYNNTASGDFSFVQGYSNLSGGYSDAVYGTFNTTTEPSSDNGYRFTAGLRNIIDVSLGGVALGNGHHVSSLGTTAVGQASLQTSGGANSPTSPMLVVGNGDFNYNLGDLNVTSRSNAFVAYKSGSIVAPSLTNALIDDEATGKALVTKEWVTGNGFVPYTGATGSVDLGNNNLTSLLQYNRGVIINDSSNTANALNLKTATLGSSLAGAGYVSLISNTVDYLSIYYGVGSKVADLDGSALTARRTFTFPDESGILPLSVNGETADAAGNITVGNLVAITGASGGVGSRSISWSNNQVVKYQISAAGNMTFSDTSLPAGTVYQKKEFYVEGGTGSTATFPAYWTEEAGGDALTFPSFNRIIVTCFESTSGSEEFYYRVENIS